jgi:protein TonB
MERPSHVIFRYQTVSHRLTWAGLSLLLPAGMFWLFANGLTASVVRTFVPPDITIERFKPEPPKKPLPPEPKLIKRVETLVIPPPDFTIGRDPDARAITVTAPTGTGTQQPAVPDRTPVGIAATRTTPPYPIIARRVGWEGTVMLRLTVSPQGRVSRADVVTSSGHVELDQAAQNWVVAHWTYRPAIKDGSAIEAQVLTKVLFSLDGQR